MKKYLWLVIMMSIAMLALIGCKEAENGGTDTVELEGNATTTYDWYFVDMTQEGIVRYNPNKDDYKPFNTGLAGSPGIYIFTFEAVAPGTTQLNFLHHDRFDNTKAPNKGAYCVATVDADLNLTIADPVINEILEQ